MLLQMAYFVFHHMDDKSKPVSPKSLCLSYLKVLKMSDKPWVNATLMANQITLTYSHLPANVCTQFTCHREHIVLQWKNTNLGLKWYLIFCTHFSGK